MADLKQVAERAGVSRATAARVFASPELVREATRDLVLEAARALRFRPNRLGRQLRQQTTRLIGVVVPSLQNPVFAEQLQAMEQRARERGYSLLLATTDYCQAREREVVEDLLRQRVDGLVLTVTDAEHSVVLADLAREATPFILAYHEPEQPYAAVSVDNHQGMAMATDYLVEQGHRHIGLVAGPALQSDRAQRRFAGYCAAMSAQGLTPLPIIEMPSHTRASLAALQPWLCAEAPPSALLCTNDLLAISLIAELRRGGIQVPRDVSVIGFDGIALGEQLHPSLCTVVQPIARLGETLIDQLLAQIQGAAPVLYRLPCRIRPGESVHHPKESSQ